MKKRTKAKRRHERATGHVRATLKRPTLSLSFVTKDTEKEIIRRQISVAPLSLLKNDHPMVFEGERLLEDSYLVYAGYVYVADGMVVESMITGNVARLRHDLETRGTSA